MFQIPIGPWPHPVGTRLRVREYPEWGIGTVVSDRGQFTVEFFRTGNRYIWRYDHFFWERLGWELEGEQ